MFTAPTKAGWRRFLPNRGLLFVGFLMQVLLSGCAIIMSIWVEMPWFGVVALGLLGTSLMATDTVTVTRRERVGKWVLAFAWVCSVASPVSLLLAKSRVYTLDVYYAVMTWLNASGVLLTSIRVANVALKTRWKVVAVTWAFFGGLIWLAASYMQNQWGAFHIGLLVNLVLLIFCELWFRMPALGILTVNTLILLLVGLPIADLFICPTDRLAQHPDAAKKYYSYVAAKKDPTAFIRWWNVYLEQWNLLEKDIFVRDTSGVLPWRLRPNSHGLLFQSQISINSQGFRGKEIPQEKGNAYRIVALGESTTFGITLNAEDRPWPELLEQMIREQLKPRQPVEVINASIAGLSLRHNLLRLPEDILPLKPDMIISYHGVNGFHLLDKALPPAYGRPPPLYRQRPLKVLSDCEYRLKMIFYKRLQTSELIRNPPTFSNPLETEYAEAYRQLIQIAQTNGIRLVLATFSMAVNDRSDRDVVEFYQASFPSVRGQILGNLVHSMIVQKMAEQHPEVCLVDTHPHLDGDHEKFIDLVHLTQDGRQQLAETLFAGIRKILEEDFSRSNPASAKR
jgi:lysophospholipase L1-like esterase